MALFKISKGNSANLPAEMHDGYCYFTIDDGKFYIDYLDINDNNTLKRRPIAGVSVEYIEGTQTASTNAWTGVTRDNALYKGKIIAYKLPYQGTSSAATLNLTLSNGTTSGAKAIKRQGASSTTTHYPAGTVIFMAYDGTYWQVNADYDSNTNTFVTQSETTATDWRKVLLHYTTNSEGGNVPAEVTNKVYAAKGIEVQPSTGTLAATKFKGPLEGNADTATEFSSVANVTLTGDVSGSANSTKGWDIATTLATTGVTAGSYGPSANATPGYGSTFNVPYITVDAKGRITAASTKTVTIPASDNTNTTYTLSGAYGSNDTAWVNTLTPSSGSATTSTVPSMVGASSSAAGKAGLVTKPAAGDQGKFLRGDGTWQTVTVTDTLVTQTNVASTTNKDYRLILSNDANDTTETKGVNKNTNLRYNPSTNLLSTGNLSLTGTLAVTGAATFSDNATVNGSLTAGSLLVNGNSSFVNDVSFTKIPTAPTAAAGTNNTQLATTAFVMNAFTANDAMVFKGVVNSASELPATHSQGWTYKVGTSGAYVGTYCEIGDLIICVTDGTSANNAHWAVIQNNVDGAVFMGHGGSAIGGATQPVYVKSTGEVVAGTALKALAYKDSISYTPAGTIANTSITPAGTISSTSITPAGTNAKSAVTIKATTTDVYSMTSAGSVTAGTAASLTMTVDENEVLSFSWTANTPTAVTLPGRSSVIKAWTGYTTGVDNTYAAAQVFTGTAASHNHTFTGTAASHNHTFTGTAATLS